MKTFAPLFTSALITTTATIASAAVTFDFIDTGGVDPTDDIDPGTVNSAMTATDGIDTIDLTIIDILSPEYLDNGSGFVATGNTLSATNGDVITNINGNADALGINNLNISNGDFDTIGAGTEANDFNTGESLIFEFDTTVFFNNIEFESAVAGNVLTVLVDGVSVASFDGADGVATNSALSAVVIPAGTDITFAASGPISNTDFRIESFTVTVVPEPSSSLLLSLTGFALLARRRC